MTLRILSVVRLDRRRGLLDDCPWQVAAGLEAWADWCRRYRRGMYGGGSAAYRMMQAKKLGIGVLGTTVEPVMPAHIAWFDKAIARLARVNGPEQQALRVHYRSYAPSLAKAAECGCTVATFYRRVRRARALIAEAWVLRGTVDSANISGIFRARWPSSPRDGQAPRIPLATPA